MLCCFILSLFIVSVTLGIQTAAAATYYVSPAGASVWSQCTDIALPCAAGTAMTNAVAGDTVYFRGGTYSITGPRTPYNGLLQPSNNGTQSNPIVFQAYPGEIPVISINCTSPDNQCVAIGTNARNYITWDGFTLTTSNNKTAGIFIGGESWSTGAVFKNSTVIAGSLPVPYTDNFDITRMEKTSYAFYINNKVGGLRTASPGDNNAALKMYHNDHATIENNEFFDSPMGISAKSDLDYSTIRNNYFHGNYEDFRTNIFTGIISFYDPACPSNRIYNNVFANTRFMAIDVQADGDDVALANDWRIYNNTIYAPTSSWAMYLGKISNLVVYNNIIVTGSNGQMTTVRSGSTVLEADHNLYGAGVPFQIKLNRYSGASIFSSFSAWTSSGALVNGGNPGAGSLVSAPMFVNSSGNMNQLADFGLAQNSPRQGGWPGRC